MALSDFLVQDVQPMREKDKEVQRTKRHSTDGKEA